MATKRKKKIVRKKTNQVQVPFPVLLANVLVLVAVLGLSYMWLCARCDALGKEIKKKEAELAAANKRLTIEQDRWSIITAPANLERAIRKHHLEMSMPSENQIVRVGVWKSNGQVARVKRDS